MHLFDVEATCTYVHTLNLFLGRLFDRVDLIQPVSYVRPFIRPSIHRKLLFDFS